MVTLFADTVVRRLPGDAGVWIMNRADRGWAEYGREYASVADIEARHAVTVGPWSTDAHGAVAPVTRLR